MVEFNLQLRIDILEDKLAVTPGSLRGGSDHERSLIRQHINNLQQQLNDHKLQQQFNDPTPNNKW